MLFSKESRIMSSTLLGSKLKYPIKASMFDITLLILSKFMFD